MLDLFVMQLGCSNCSGSILVSKKSPAKFASISSGLIWSKRSSFALVKKLTQHQQEIPGREHSHFCSTNIHWDVKLGHRDSPAKGHFRWEMPINLSSRVHRSARVIQDQCLDCVAIQQTWSFRKQSHRFLRANWNRFVQSFFSSKKACFACCKEMI